MRLYLQNLKKIEKNYIALAIDFTFFLRDERAYIKKYLCVLHSLWSKNNSSLSQGFKAVSGFAFLTQEIRQKLSAC